LTNITKPQKLITNQKQFLEICRLIEEKKFVALDTEFMRETTYYAVLCLIQINISDECFVVDALDSNINLEPFFKILNNPKIIKVFHSVRQDIAVIAQFFPKISPKSIFDTQVMASFCGVGYDIGYANLVKIFFNKDLDKAWQRSDWQKRPLHQDQIEYAAIDVLYLPEIYKILLEKLSLQKKLNWLDEEMDFIVKRAMNDDIYKKFLVNYSSEVYQKNIKLLVSWRDNLAKNHNIPRSFVIKDKILGKIAYQNPQTISELEKCGFQSRVGNKIKDEIINLIADKNGAISSEIRPHREFKMTKAKSALYQESRELLQRNAIENNLSAQLIINQEDLKNIILGHKNIAKTLTGWRLQVFGEDLEILINNL
jgi:ribonuclease D